MSVSVSVRSKKISTRQICRFSLIKKIFLELPFYIISNDVGNVGMTSESVWSSFNKWIKSLLETFQFRSPFVRPIAPGWNCLSFTNKNVIIIMFCCSQSSKAIQSFVRFDYSSIITLSRMYFLFRWKNIVEWNHLQLGYATFIVITFPPPARSPKKRCLKGEFKRVFCPAVSWVSRWNGLLSFLSWKGYLR